MGVKGKKRAKRGSKLQYFYGYKSNATMNAASVMSTSVLVTGGNAHDGKQFLKLVGEDRE